MSAVSHMRVPKELLIGATALWVPGKILVNFDLKLPT